MYNSRNLSNMGTSDSLSPRVRGGKRSSFGGVDCDMAISRLLWTSEGKSVAYKGACPARSPRGPREIMRIDAFCCTDD